MLLYSSRMTSSLIESKPGDHVRLVGDALVVADVFDGFCREETIKGRLKITSNFSWGIKEKNTLVNKIWGCFLQIIVLIVTHCRPLAKQFSCKVVHGSNEPPPRLYSRLSHWHFLKWPSVSGPGSVQSLCSHLSCFGCSWLDSQLGGLRVKSPESKTEGQSRGGRGNIGGAVVVLQWIEVYPLDFIIVMESHETVRVLHSGSY